MPALRAWISKFALLLLCVLLSACDRHNDTSEPDDLLDDEKIVCEWMSEFPDDVDYVHGVSIENASQNAQLSQGLQFDPDIFEYDLHAGYMVSSTRIDINEVVVSEYSDALAQLIIEVNDERLTEENAFFEVPLTPGENEVVLEVTASRIETLRKSADEAVNTHCGYPSQRRIDEALEKNNPSPVPTRRVDDPLTYTFRITRQTMGQLQNDARVLSSALISSLSANDRLGSQVLMGQVITSRELGTTRDILVVGVPLEDSNARGVIPLSELTTQAQDDSAEDSGAVFIYERATDGEWGLRYYLKAPYADAGDQFGSALAFHDNLLVVSALGEDSQASGINGPQDNNLARDSGAVYVYEFLEQGVWRQRAFIKKPLNSMGIDGFNDGFGTALSFENDVLLISAPKEDSPDGRGGNVSLPNSGAVYLYTIQRDGIGNFGTLAQDATFKAQNPNSGDYFGSSLDMAPGATRFVVGAPGESSDYRGILDLRVLGSESPENSYLDSNAASDAGAVYMFYLSEQSGWSGDAYFYMKSSNGDAGDHFGASLQFLNDDTLLVGAPMEDSDGDGFNRNLPDNSAPNSGAVYLYTRDDDDIWSFEHFVKAPHSESDEHFGSALTSYGKSFVVSAPGTRNVMEMLSGQVYGYEFEPEKPLNEQLLHYLTLSGQDPDPDVISTNQRYGRSLSLFGATLAVGAPGLTRLMDGVELEQAGGVFVYQ